MNNLPLFPEHEWDYVDRSAERVKLAWSFHHNMNPDGKPMLLAFSGGKDSICLFYVCKRAAEELNIPMEEMYNVQYSITGVDPPELVYFIRDFKKKYPFIELRPPKKTMWKLIEEYKIPPTRKFRYCCAELKETVRCKGGYTLTGVRRAESARRSQRRGFEKDTRNKEKRFLDDNAEDRRETEYCMQRNTYICNPIIDWSDEAVWHFIKEKNLPYCKLYDEGYRRLGCIGCPMASVKERARAFSRYPKYADLYKRAFQKMIDACADRSKLTWADGEEVFHWWLYGGKGE